MDIDGKVALVTGAGYGIGRAIAIGLANEGAAVVVNDIDEQHGRETVAKIVASGGRAAFVHADVTSDGDVARMLAFAEGTFGGLDILVNNAAPDIVPPFFPTAPADGWLRTLDVCLIGLMRVTQQALAAMATRGGGAIVNLSSMAGIGFGPHDAPEYAAAKAAIVRLTATLAPLKEPMNVRVNCICPNWVATEKVRALVVTLTDEMRKSWYCPPIEAMARPEDIAEAVISLLRDDTFAGRTILYDGPGERFLVPQDIDVFSLGEKM